MAELLRLYKDSDNLVTVEVQLPAGLTLEAASLAAKAEESDPDDDAIFLISVSTVAGVNGVISDVGNSDNVGMIEFVVRAEDLADAAKGAYSYGGKATLSNGRTVPLKNCRGVCHIGYAGPVADP